MRTYSPTPPANLLALAERESWFHFDDGQLVLDWLEQNKIKLLGIDTARKSPDGNWMLLVDPMLDLGSAEEDCDTIEEGRRFLAANEVEDFMFELVW